VSQPIGLRIAVLIGLGILGYGIAQIHNAHPEQAIVALEPIIAILIITMTAQPFANAAIVAYKEGETA